MVKPGAAPPSVRPVEQEAGVQAKVMRSVGALARTPFTKHSANDNCSICHDWQASGRDMIIKPVAAAPSIRPISGEVTAHLGV